MELRQIVEDGDADINEPNELDDPMEEGEDNRDVLTVYQFWRQFNVGHAIDHLMAAWDHVNMATVRHGWRKMTPHLVPKEPQDPSQPVQRSADAVSDALREAHLVPGVLSLRVICVCVCDILLFLQIY